MKSFIRLLFLLICSFFTAAGIAILFIYGEKGFQFIDLPGGARFGAIAYWSYALMGLLFTAVFGYLVTRIITPALALVQAGCFLLIATAGHLANQQYTETDHLVSLDSEMKSPLQLDEMKLYLTKLNVIGIQHAADITIKAGKGEHTQTLIMGQTISERGWNITYWGSFDDAISIACLYQPGSFWMRVGNIGCVLSIAASGLCLLMRKKKTPASSQDTPQSSTH